MSRITENTGFCCVHCGRTVLPLTNGSYRNHCPFCLHSLHVDIMPGDRLSQCGGIMEPVGLKCGHKGYQIIFRCVRCGVINVNRVAENTGQPDDINSVVKLLPG
jgi:hypothetical protein